jgi:hypothetical protein
VRPDTPASLAILIPPGVRCVVRQVCNVILEPVPGYPILKVTMPRSGADYITAELEAQNVVSVGGLQVGSVHATQVAAIAAALASVPTSSPTSDPCEFANDGTCDVPRYCKDGDYADCLAGAPGPLGLLRSSPSRVVPWLPWVSGFPRAHAARAVRIAARCYAGPAAAVPTSAPTSAPVVTPTPTRSPATASPLPGGAPLAHPPLPRPPALTRATSETVPSLTRTRASLAHCPRWGRSPEARPLPGSGCTVQQVTSALASAQGMASLKVTNPMCSTCLARCPTAAANAATSGIAMSCALGCIGGGARPKPPAPTALPPRCLGGTSCIPAWIHARMHARAHHACPGLHRTAKRLARPPPQRSKAPPSRDLLWRPGARRAERVWVVLLAAGGAPLPETQPPTARPTPSPTTATATVRPTSSPTVATLRPTSLAPTFSALIDPCAYQNDGICDVPSYCAVGDYVDCSTDPRGILGKLQPALSREAGAVQFPSTIPCTQRYSGMTLLGPACPSPLPAEG